MDFYCSCTSSYILKLLCMWSAMIFLDWLIYCNAIIMKQGSCSIFCAGAVMTHHDTALFQKAGTTGLRTGSLSCIDVPCPSPGAPPEFSHSWGTSLRTGSLFSIDVLCLSPGAPLEFPHCWLSPASVLFGPFEPPVSFFDFIISSFRLFYRLSYLKVMV